MMLGQSFAVDIPVPPSDDLPLAMHGLSISPEEKTFLVNFIGKRRTSFGSDATVIPLRSPFNNECIAEYIQQNHYLDANQREAFRVTCNEGSFYDADNHVLQGTYVVILFPNNRLYAAHVNEQMNHSYLSAGLGLKGAGMGYFECGRLMTLSNESGHYTPTFEEMKSAIRWFHQQTDRHAFVFEDHSAQDNTLEFNGIRFFHVACAAEELICDISLIENKNLATVLQQVRSCELDYYYAHLPHIPVAPRAKVEADDPNTYTTEVTYKEPIVPDTPILECKELLNITCLSKYLDNIRESKPVSRYGCILRHSK